MARDRLLSSAIYDGGDAVPNFPLGGNTTAPVIAHDALTVLSPADLEPEISSFWMDVPGGSSIRFGRLDRLKDLPLAEARARMFPLAGGTRYSFTLTDEHQHNVAFLADGPAPVTVSIAEAAVVGGSR